MELQDTDVTDLSDRRGDGVSKRDDTHLLHHEITRAIIGAFYSVHSHLGSGFVESVYANALAIVLRDAGIAVEREVPLKVDFKGVTVGQFRADLVVQSTIIIEVKSARAIDSTHIAQLWNYLRASNLKVGLVLNFGRSAEFRRVIT